MADDLKKKLIQYGDKVLFGIFVIALLATAAITVAGKPSASDSPLPTPGTYKPKAETLDDQIAKLNEAFEEGGIPSGFVAGGFATDPDEINPRPGEAVCKKCGWIMPESVLRCPRCGAWRLNDDDGDGMPNDWEDRFDVVDRYTPDATEDPDQDGFTNLKEYLGGSDPSDPKSIPSPFRLARSYRKRVDIRFKGYTVNPGGDSDVIDPDYWVLQMNYGRGSDTAFVKLGGYLRGYHLYPLETKKVLRKGRGGIPDWTEDVYILAIQRRNQPPIKLEKGKWGTTNETYVDLEVTRGRDSGKRYTGLTIGDVIHANGERFEIVEMRDGNVIMEGSEGEIYTLY
jgi:hypothetical protein